MDPVIVISGPTASGKTALSLQLAQKLNAEIVNADAVQIYKEFDIGSAKPGAEELEQVPHHLMSVLEPTEQCDAAKFVSLAEDCFSAIRARRKLPLLVGGSTFYLSALFSGLDSLPGGSAKIRKELESYSDREIYEELQKRDPDKAATLHKNDRYRTARALEILLAQSSRADGDNSRVGGRERALILVMCWNRRVLRRRIATRTESMLREGVVDETRVLLESYGESCPALRSLGYRQVMEFLSGERDEGSLFLEISTRTKRFAKRQMTFWRNEPVKRGWKLRPAENEEAKALGDELPDKAGKRPAFLKSVRVLSWDFETLMAELEGYQLKGEAEVWYLDAEVLLDSLKK